jgi:hypothetical protein
MSDITKSPIEQLFDYINLTATVVLDYNDFNLTIPQPYSKIGVKANTKIIISPKTNAVYYNSKDIYYYRMGFSEIFSTGLIEVLPDTEAKLSDLIPKINLAFGINLTADDYYDQDLPLYDPTGSVNTHVTIVAKETSLLFFGSYNLVLGSRAVPVTDTDNVTRVLYLVKSGVSAVNYRNKLTCINNDGTTNTAFSFLRNAVTVTTVDITAVILNTDKDLLLKGTFDLTYQNLGQVTPTNVSASFIIIGPNGAIKSFNNTGLRANIDQVSSLDSINNFYILDKTDSTKPASVFKFDKEGFDISNYSASGISYVPSLIKMSPEGFLYTVSPTYIDNGAKVRIDRLTASGIDDTTFNPIVISNTSVNTVMQVVNLDISSNGDLWVLVNPPRGVSSTADTPIINGVNIVPGNSVSPYAWNPIFKFTNSGTLITEFNTLLKDFDPRSIYDSANGLVQGNELVKASGTSVVMFTIKNNPATGFSHRQPIVFNQTGGVTLLSGVDYSSMFRWVNSTNLFTQSNGKILAYGTMLPKLADGGWGDPITTIGRYSNNGAPIEIIYREDATSLVDTNVSISKIIMLETV